MLIELRQTLIIIPIILLSVITGAVGGSTQPENSAVATANVPLRAFTASYDLTRGSMNLGKAELSLQPIGKMWQLRLSTRARGIYAMFIDKNPLAETSFSNDQDQLRLDQIVISDEKDEDKYESASFDWKKGQMKVLRKGKLSNVALTDSVYDYQSIHLVTAAMQIQQLEHAEVAFYRKGKLTRSSISYRGESSVTINGNKTDAQVFEQTTTGSKTRVKYFYDAQNPLLPLLIERRKSGDTPIILRLRKVDWQS